MAQNQPLLGKAFNGEGGWAGASEGRAISKCFTNWGGSNLLSTQPGEGDIRFGKEKNSYMSVS